MTATRCTTSTTIICKTCFKAEKVTSKPDTWPIRVTENSVRKPLSCVRPIWKANKRWMTWSKSVSSWVKKDPKRSICIILQRTVRKQIRVITSSTFGPRMVIRLVNLRAEKTKTKKDRRERKRRNKKNSISLRTPLRCHSARSKHTPKVLCLHTLWRKRLWVKLTRLFAPPIET